MFLLAWAWPLLAASPTRVEKPYFGIRVVDGQTGRGVPLVELRTVNEIALHTDSAGWIAFHEPGLMGREVYFGVRSPGYEHPPDGFGNRGVRLTPTPGATAPDNTWRHPRGNAVRLQHGGQAYFYFAKRFAPTRVRADWANVLDPDRYEALAYDPETRDYRWQRAAAPTTQDDEDKLLQAGRTAAGKARYQLTDALTTPNEASFNRIPPAGKGDLV